MRATEVTAAYPATSRLTWPGAGKDAPLLTAAGHALIERTVRQLPEHEADLIGALSPEERAALTRFLAKLERSLT